ncbi:Peptide-N(4)-(N-acetyl-beta-glucosaminyl)asparagine amidase [Zea mays]|uniref:Peptide-N(4)-(N-acetyl-beta-glucosaminyl)asparagine amidase n=2 Tax=Zea mays TaxID=4577 RepID=A0A1D6EW29_MAIZE|nr:Peptide-N(4)-(N-acetyl-beta-glucosaminyl)asparagine amidase [Zea mays]
MVARRFVVRHGPAAGGSAEAAEEQQHEVEYDTEHGLDVLRLQIFSLTAVPPDLQKIVVEADGSVVDDGTDLEAVSERLRLLAIGEEGEDDGAAARAQEKSDEEFARMLQYEDSVGQEAAQKTVPICELEEKALVSLAKEGNFNPSKDEEKHAFLLQLLFWFKQSFRWVNAAPCDSCGRETSNVGMGTPLTSEIKFGASRVEMYRFWISLITCGQNVFQTCMEGQWMHLDPCEGVYDNPLLYEKGWNKKLNYVIAISKDGVRDVTKRYTRKWHEVLSRRIITSEETVVSVLSSITGKYRTGLSPDALSVIENREKEESEELRKSAYLQVETALSLPGRLSGSVEWRKARSELGQADSLSCSSCPIRKCVDGHVSNIYDALSAFLSHFFDKKIPKERIIEAFEALKTLMLTLKSSNFKSRSATLDQKAHHLFEEIFPSIERLLSAISLKAELGTAGYQSVTVSGNPVHSSLALPVALDAVNEILSNYKNNTFFTEGNHFPRGNRVCSGSVLASREQLPIGIATAAFDGIHSSKWEEPDGAKGCWLIYTMQDGKSCELESYDLMSANDAPERDPMDWVLEGSADGGSTWNILDARNSEMFESRFLRKTFTVDKRYKANAFRFRFLRVRDSHSNPRFQIGSIDLYGKTI